jgi:NAD(P)-dependent dehydrogenase (short-subunit alcohol dehydrogenase family)
MIHRGEGMRFRDKVCFITGAGSGIGRKTAVLMAREGAKVAVLSRTMEEVEEAAEEIRAGGGEAIPVCADISDPGELSAAVEEVVKAYGRIDVVFANAGVNGVWAPIEDLEVEEWDQTIAINLRGTFLTLKYTVPHLKKRGGSIVINASVNGTRVFSNSGATAYASSKAAQVAMAKMTALELARSRVRVNVICPGAIDTGIEENTEARGIEKLGVPVEFPEGMHPLRGAPADAEHVARVVLFLASDDAEHVTGTELWIDGAESLIGMRG